MDDGERLVLSITWASRPYKVACKLELIRGFLASVFVISEKVQHSTAFGGAFSC